MNQVNLLEWVTLAFVAGLAVMFVLGRARSRYLARLLDELRGQLEDGRKFQNRLIGERDEERRRAKEYFDRIDGIVSEANGLRKLYASSNASHAAAQDMMLRERESICRQYASLAELYRAKIGQPPPRMQPVVNAIVEQVAGQYREGQEVHAGPQPIPTEPPAAS